MTSPQQRQYTLDVLNKLHAAQKWSLLPRLAELNAFVEWAHAQEMQQVTRMIEEDRCHEEWLVQAADKCHGVLLPASPDASTAGLHYIDLPTLLPLTIASIEKLANVYAGAVQESAALAPAAAETITRIYHRHQSHLEQLRGIQMRLEPLDRA